MYGTVKENKITLFVLFPITCICSSSSYFFCFSVTHFLFLQYLFLLPMISWKFYMLFKKNIFEQTSFIFI